jgi:hypothetical protein
MPEKLHYPTTLSPQEMVVVIIIIADRQMSIKEEGGMVVHGMMFEPNFMKIGQLKS